MNSLKNKCKWVASKHKKSVHNHIRSQTNAKFTNMGYRHKEKILANIKIFENMAAGKF